MSDGLFLRVITLTQSINGNTVMLFSKHLITHESFIYWGRTGDIHWIDNFSYNFRYIIKLGQVEDYFMWE